VTRAWTALAAGLVLLATAFVVPCLTFADWAANGLPYQDPTTEMLQKQAADDAALRSQLVTRLWIGGGLAALGVAALIYAWRHRRGRSLLGGRKVQQ
jgi:hypothetical protein